MTEIGKPKQYDLEERTLRFAKEVRSFIKELPKTVAGIEDFKQLSRSSGSVGANYIEANESLGKKDFVLRIRICRKEAKESIYWLQLLDIPSGALATKRQLLVQEAIELMKIFSAIMHKSV